MAGKAPEEWKLRRLGEVATIVGGGTPKTSEAGNFMDQAGHPWITPADLAGYTEKYISHGRRFLTDRGLASSSAKYMPAGTVLFSSRAPIGYVAIAANPVTTNQGFRSFVPSDEVDSEYLYHALRFLKPLAEQMASGTTFPELSGSKAAGLPISFPALGMQRAIARALDHADGSGRSALKHLLAARRATERFRPAVLAAACSGRLTDDWREAHPDVSSEEFLQRVAERREALVGPRAKPPSPIASQDLQSIPTSWRWASVDSLALRVVDGVHKTPTYRETGIPFVTVRNLTAGPGLSLDGARFISEEDHARFCMRAKPERGDLLISKDGTIGVTRAIRTDPSFSIFVSVALIKPVFQTMTDYLELALSSPPVQEQMIGVGSGLQHLVLRDLKADAVPIPPPEEQTEIVRRVSSLLVKAGRLTDAIDRASRQVERSQTALLAKAFHGELVTKGNSSG